MGGDRRRGFALHNPRRARCKYRRIAAAAAQEGIRKKRYYQWIGSGEGSNQQSNALYKYIKLVNKDVVDGINSVNTADNSTITEIYTLGGARVNSLQKGINIVRLANGKTVKVIK
ncbi:MAG: hypothetical protein SO104_06720 [Prevotella sp.]|nr:hypothetical protein [Prevotella sp.]